MEINFLKCQEWWKYGPSAINGGFYAASLSFAVMPVKT